MGMTADIVYTDASGEDVGMIASAEGDFSVGEENTWQLTVPDSYPISQGCFVYLDGERSEFGGVVDDIETTSRGSTLTVSGRTWHGILASRIVCPPAGAGHAVLTGDANACIAEVLELCEAGDPFAAATAESGIRVDGYTMPRYCDAYAGITGMLASAGASLDVSYHRGSCTLGAKPAALASAYSEDIGLDLKRRRATNHLVCLGSGELADRTVVHLYADAQGRVSREQSIFGAAHMADVYELSNASDEAELVREGAEQLESMQSADTAEIDGELSGTYRIGQTVTARDERRGASAEETVTQLIARVSGRTVTVESKVGGSPSPAEEPA